MGLDLHQTGCWGESIALFLCHISQSNTTPHRNINSLTAAVCFCSWRRAQYRGCPTWAWPASSLTSWASGWDQVGVWPLLAHSLRCPCGTCHLLTCFVSLPSAGVTGVLPTEIFNQTARPAAYMIAGSMMWINLFITGMVFPFLVVSLCFCQQADTQNSAEHPATVIYSQYRWKTDIPVAPPPHRYNYQHKIALNPQSRFALSKEVNCTNHCG